MGRPGGRGDAGPGQGGLVQRDAPPCRRRKVRSAPFPCTAKTAPTPLHPKGTSAPTPWAWAILLSPPCGARRDPLSVLPKEKRAVHGPKRKALARSGAVALRATIGASADLVWPLGTPGPFAIPVVAALWRIVRTARSGHCMFSPSLFAAAGPVGDGSFCSRPMLSSPAGPGPCGS